MIQTITIGNYKSIHEMTIELGRVNVLIGANGAGKSNILEAIALCAATFENKLDNEFLASRGVRVTDPIFMRSAFDVERTTEAIKLSVQEDSSQLKFALENRNEPYPRWYNEAEINDTRGFIESFKSMNISEELLDSLIESLLEKTLDKIRPNLNKDDKLKLVKQSYWSTLSEQSLSFNFGKFIIYSPENSSLRTFECEGQIQPLGINGEGLLKLIRVIDASGERKKIEAIKNILKLTEWFGDFEIPQENGEGVIKIRDEFVDPSLTMYTQRSTSEGLLFLLFYAALFVSKDTPTFFAIDNIEASLNPKLCTQLMIELTNLAKTYDKQVIFTTHNPAILDGLNLDDPEQRLMVVSRNKRGHTRLKTVQKPKTREGQEPVKLSEAFLNGMIGGLPKGF